MNKRILFLSALCAVSIANAGKALSSSPAKAAVVSDDSNGWNACVHTGHAWSLKSGVKNPDTAVFGVAVETALDDAKIGKSSFAGLALSKNLWSWLSAGVSYDLYSGFNYRAYHKGATAVVDTAGKEQVTAAFERSFDLNHSSALFNVNLSLPEDWRMDVGSMSISPALGAGVGIGVNEVANFRMLDSAGAVRTVADNNSKASLAWHACGGLNFQAEDSNVGFGLNYRYYYGGKFASAGKYMLNNAANIAGEVTAKAWEGKVKAHQLQFALNWAF